MPYTNSWEKAGLYRKFTQEISGDEILKSNIELHSDPGFEYIQYVINDFTEVTGHSIETSHTNAYAVSDEIISNTKGRLKIALVVTEPSLIILANNYRELMRGKRFECDIFSSVEDARVWVGA